MLDINAKYTDFMYLPDKACDIKQWKYREFAI